MLTSDSVEVNESKIPTKFIMVCNAGLVSGIQQEDVVQLFTKFGVVQKVLMIPGKSYCFVEFKDVSDAETAYSSVNGKQKLDKMDGVIYLLFTDSVPRNMCSLTFDKVPSGLTLIEDFVTETEEQFLLNCINWSQTDEHLGRVMKHRRVKHYGYEFQYGTNNIDKTKPLQEKLPRECDFLKERVTQKGYGNLLPWTPNQLTINQYQKGQGIPSHIDTHSAFDSPILSLSLGSDVVMEFRRENQHLSILLPQRSLLIMDGEARYAWTHGIVPRNSDVIPVGNGLTVRERGTRTSFTFRHVRIGDCSCKYKEFCDTWKPKNIPEDDAWKLELRYVHEVYENIADHFSETRHSPWPNIRQFVESLKSGSILVDIGCGNGKYFGINKSVFEVGCDYSTNLTKEAFSRGYEVFNCNCLSVPLKSNFADGVISIAVLHHLSTTHRRLQALKEIIRILSIGGHALVYVWSKDQNKNNKMSSYLKQDRKNLKEKENVNDHNFVKLENIDLEYKQIHSAENVSTEKIDGSKLNESNIQVVDSERSSGLTNESKEVTCENQSEENCAPEKNRLETVKSGFNLPVHENRKQFYHQDVLVPWKLKHLKTCGSEADTKTFLRYYHLFEEDELKDMCNSFKNVKLLNYYYDNGNWCALIEKISRN